MTTKQCLTLIIDACVLGSAGVSDKPDSARSRTFLDAVEGSDHNVGITREIVQEWNRHTSNRSRGWRLRMADKGKFVPVKTYPLKDVRVAITNLLAPSSQAPAEKDVHLVEAAIQADNLLFSADGKARRFFKTVAQQSPLVARVAWLNPILDLQTCLVCLTGWGNQEIAQLSFGAGEGAEDVAASKQED